MGAVVGMLGLGGGPGGSDVSVTNPTNAQQIAGAQQGVQAGIAGQNNLLNAIQSTGGGQGALQNQSNIYNQLQNIAAGQGPNPAQTMLNQATGQNVANQAALAAGQRGAASNVGLLARQAAQQGSSAQQQAAGQAATMQANQSLGALQQAQNEANVQAGQFIGQTNTNAQNQLQAQQQLLNAQQGYNSANAGIGAAQAGTAGSLTGGLIGGLANQGIGAIGNMIGGSSTEEPETSPEGTPTGPGSAAMTGVNAGFMAQGGYAGDMGAGTPAAKGGSILSQYLAKGGNVGSALKSGGHVPGKPKVGGATNSYSNDTVSAKLSPGEIVLPRSVTMSKDPVNASAAFVRATLAKKGKR